MSISMYEFQFCIIFDTLGLNAQILLFLNKQKHNITQTYKPSPVCDEAWERHGEKQYYFSTFKSSWNIGRRFCKEFGADLVKIDSEEEQVNDTQTSPLPHVSDEDKFWIGLTDSKTEGKWVWVDGSPLKKRLQFWWNDRRNMEPDNWTGEDPDGEDCVRMGELGPVTKLNRWLDKTCKMAQRSICEKPAKRQAV
uniref:Hepatic lectin-like n=1 Tax=Sphaeramia orbicularis TaxID=375764 RepID=A0A672Z8P0_9TELE